MGFHPEGGDKAATSSLNRERKLGRVRAGTAYAAMVFDGDDCVGWCQFDSSDGLRRFKSRAAYEKGQTMSPDWRLACCFVHSPAGGPNHRPSR
jgi:hypothetical protein